jgi:acyl-coenzyme A synthetase/AMP-(fatty) acid ligase
VSRTLHADPPVLGRLVEAIEKTARRSPKRTALKDAREALSYGELLELLSAVPRGFWRARGSRVLSVSSRASDVIDLLIAATSGQDALVLDGAATAREAALATARFRDAGDRSDAPMLALCTSGTTGMPKVVELAWPETLANALSFGTAAGFADEVIWCSTPLHHRYCLAAGVLAGLLTGSSVLLAPGGIGPDELSEQILAEQVTTVMSVPFLFAHYVEEVARRPELVAQWTVRRCISAGAPLPPEVAKRWEAVSGIPILPHYGSTEDGQVTLGRGHIDEGVGRPLPDREVKVSQTGELLVRARTEDLAGAAPWRATGDLARIDSHGNVHITGRATDRMNLAGKKVDPTEVEDCLLRHASVADCVVGGVPTRLGDEIVAFVVTDESTSDADLRSHLADLLSRHKLPRRFVRLPEIPRTQSGKPRRGLLLASLSEAPAGALTAPAPPGERP